MAVLPQQKEDQSTMNVLGQPASQQPAQQTPTLGAPSAVGGGTSAPQQTTPSSGLFTSLNKYLAANQGAGQKVGQAIQQKAQTQATQTGQAVAEKLGQYQTGAQQTAQNIGQTQQFGTELISGIQAGQANLTPEQIERYKAAERGLDVSGRALSTTAPLDIAEQQRQQAALQQQAQQAQTASGTFKMLNQFFQTPERRYTPGQQALDVAFLRRTPGAVQETQSAVKGAAQQTKENVEKAQKEADTQQQALGEASKKLQETLATQRGAAQTGLQEKIQKQGEEAQKRQSDVQAQIDAAVKSGNLTNLPAEIKSAMGIVTPTSTENIYDKILTDKYVSPEEYKQFQDWVKQQAYLQGGITSIKGDPNAYKYNLADYFQKQNLTPSQITAAVATPEQLAQAQALASLGGTTQAIIPQEELVGQGLGGQLEGFSFSPETAQARANMLTEQYFKEQVPEQSTFHPSDYQRLATYTGQMVSSGQMSPEYANALLSSPSAAYQTPGNILSQMGVISPEETGAANADPVGMTNRLVEIGRITQQQANDILRSGEISQTIQDENINEAAKQNLQRYYALQNIYNRLAGNTRTQGIWDVV